MTQITDEMRRDIINQLRVAIDWALDAEGDPHVPSAKPAVLAMTAAIGALTAALGAAPAAEAVTGRGPGRRIVQITQGGDVFSPLAVADDGTAWQLGNDSWWPLPTLPPAMIAAPRNPLSAEDPAHG